jgi:hypothetical protein
MTDPILILNPTHWKVAETGGYICHIDDSCPICVSYVGHFPDKIGDDLSFFAALEEQHNIWIRKLSAFLPEPVVSRLEAELKGHLDKKFAEQVSMPNLTRNDLLAD